jgi:hypothetical protein
LTEESSSIVVRSEHLYNKDDRHRLCLRKHVYELDGKANTRFLLTRGVIQAVQDHLQSRVDQKESDLTQDHLLEIADLLKRLVAEGGEGSTVEEAVLDSLREKLSAIGLSQPVCTRIGKIVRQHARTPLACYPIGEDDILSRYLGFVDIRTNSTLAPLALGLLVPPRELRRDPEITIVTGEYGRIFGAHGFTSTVYSMHDPKSGGAHCAQACIIMALATLADRGANVLGSYDVTYLGKEGASRVDFSPSCLQNQPGCDKTIVIDGLTQEEMVRVLEHPACRVRVDRVELPRSRTHYRMCKRLIEAYVTARYPVIMNVDTGEWYGRDKPLGHAVMIVGIRKSQQGMRASQRSREREPSVASSLDELTELIVHDPGYQPFLKRPVHECLEAARVFGRTPEERDGGNAYHLLFVTDRKIERRASECLKLIEEQDRDRWEIYIGVPHRTMGDWLWRKSARADYRITLLRLNDLVKTYAHPSYNITWLNRKFREDTDRKESDRWMSPQERARFEFLSNAARRLPRGWYWSVAGYQGKELEVLWLFNTTPRGSDRWDYRVDFKRGDEDMPALGEIPDPPRGLQPPLLPQAEEDPTEPSPPGERKPAVPRQAIRRSVITSCSGRSLAGLISEVRAISGVSLFDIFVLRDADIQDLESSGVSLSVAESPIVDLCTTTQILAHDENTIPIADWIRDQFQFCNRNHRRLGAEPAAVAALATYYPQITTRSHLDDAEDEELARKAPFRVAQKAIANTVRLALRLKKARALENPGFFRGLCSGVGRAMSAVCRRGEGRRGLRLMEHAVVEMVCGTILDQCSCEGCSEFRREFQRQHGRERDIVFETRRKDKIRQLCDRLLSVVDLVDSSDEGRGEPEWVLALELEPGPTYVLNDLEALRHLKMCLTEDPKYERLLPHVGINVDVAHMKIAEVDADDLEREFKAWIVHAHICDHPGMHTRDQIVGTWSPIDRYSGSHYPYLKLLAEIDSASPKRNGRPFTGTIALELEGCGRIGWIHQSLASMKHMMEAVKHHPERVAGSHLR